MEDLKKTTLYCVTNLFLSQNISRPFEYDLWTTFRWRNGQVEAHRAAQRYQTSAGTIGHQQLQAGRKYWVSFGDITDVSGM